MDAPLRAVIVTAAVMGACSAPDAGGSRPPQNAADSAPAMHSTHAEAQDSCSRMVARQRGHLRRDTVDQNRAFAMYVVQATRLGRRAPLDVTSLRSARTFRTKLREALDTTDVNFAGYFSIVSVPMTGWGPNYWIVDRRNGRAFEFPYRATYLAFRRSSSLLVMDPKDSIDAAKRGHPPEHQCANLGQRRLSELRPFYFVWNGSQFSQLAPADTPPRNSFWQEYFGQRPRPQ
jgi:hypothetical protein